MTRNYPELRIHVDGHTVSLGLTLKPQISLYKKDVYRGSEGCTFSIHICGLVYAIYLLVLFLKVLITTK